MKSLLFVIAVVFYRLWSARCMYLKLAIRISWLEIPTVINYARWWCRLWLHRINKNNRIYIVTLLPALSIMKRSPLQLWEEESLSPAKWKLHSTNCRCHYHCSTVQGGGGSSYLWHVVTCGAHHVYLKAENGKSEVTMDVGGVSRLSTSMRDVLLSYKVIKLHLIYDCISVTKGSSISSVHRIFYHRSPGALHVCTCTVTIPNRTK